MGEPPGEGPELHDADEARQIEDLPLQVLAVADAAEVEQLRPCVYKASQSVACRHCSRFGSALKDDVGLQGTLELTFAALAWLQQAKTHINGLYDLPNGDCNTMVHRMSSCPSNYGQHCMAGKTQARALNVKCCSSRGSVP